MSSRCTHVGCPTQPNGPLFASGASSARRRRVTTRADASVRLRLPVPRKPVRHRGQPDGRPRTAPARPVRVLDPQRPAQPRPSSTASAASTAPGPTRGSTGTRSREPGSRSAGSSRGSTHWNRHREHCVWGASPARDVQDVGRGCTDVRRRARGAHGGSRPTCDRRRSASTHALGRLVDATVFVKHENHLPTGAFKVRGGINLVSQLERRASARAASSRRRPATTASRSPTRARLFGVEATICVPEGANPVKVAAMRDLGAEIVSHGRDFDEAREQCEQLAARTRRPLHPLRERAVADRGRCNGDARDPRGRAADRHDHRPGRRRQRRGGRVHRREDARPGDPRDRRAVGRGAGRLPLVARAARWSRTR